MAIVRAIMLLHILAVLGPIFLLIAAGRILRWAGIISEAGAADLAKVLYWFALPVQLIAWSGEALLRAKWPRLDPLTRAWKDATAITPMIFRG